MKRRKVTACAMAALMAMGLVGTVMPVYAKSNLKNVDDVVEIKMAVWTSGAADIYNKAAEGFNQTHDNIKLSVEMQSGDYNQYLGAKTAAKDLPDLFEVSSYSQVYDFAQNGLLADVSDHEFVDKLYDNAKEAVTYDGKVWGFPQMYEWWGVLYNKDLFKKAGIEKVPETFDEMKAVCEKLQAANITPFTAIYKDNWTVSQEFCSLFGGVLGGKDKIDSWLDSMNKGEGSFKVDGVDRVFDFMDLMKENSGQNYMDSDAATGFYAFANQEAAMIFLSDAATISVGSVTQDLPIGFFAVPVSDNADDAEVVACATDAIVANANGEHLDEALEVLDYIGDGGDWLKTVTNSYGGFMACMDIEADDEIASKDYYKDLKAYMDAGKVRSTLWNQLPSGASDVLGDDVQGYFAGITDEDQTLDALDEGYECASNISVTYDGSPATVRSFADGDVVTVNLVNGKIASLAGESKTTTISGATIEDMEIGDDIKITISHGNDAYNGKTYAVSSDVVVKKNTSTVDLSSIYKGDKVTLTLKYGVITQINATSSTKVVEGTIQSLTIATKSIMVVKVDNKEQTYEIPSGVQILINGEEKTLYDFRVGDIVKLTVESDAITKIVATSTQESSGSMSGVVTGINTSYGVISVQPEGSTDSKQAFCKDGNTTFVTAAGIAKKMKDIKVGQKVEIKGTISGGVFIGKLVVIVSE